MKESWILCQNIYLRETTLWMLRSSHLPRWKCEPAWKLLLFFFNWSAWKLLTFDNVCMGSTKILADLVEGKKAYRDIVRSLRPWGVPIFVYNLHLHPEVFAFLITKCSGRMWYINSFTIVSTCYIVSSLIGWSPCLHCIFFFFKKKKRTCTQGRNIGYSFGSLFLCSNRPSSRNLSRLDSYGKNVWADHLPGPTNCTHLMMHAYDEPYYALGIH